MLPITQEWVDKAEGDWGSAGRDYRACRSPHFDGACYHAQQCVEKYLKAQLQEAALASPKTHDLEDLLELLLPVQPTWDSMRPALQRLTLYSVLFRYPGKTATRADAREAVMLCQRVRETIRLSLGLPL